MNTRIILLFFALFLGFSLGFITGKSCEVKPREHEIKKCEDNPMYDRILYWRNPVKNYT